jgi:hypothetical protein
MPPRIVVFPKEIQAGEIGAVVPKASDNASRGHVSGLILAAAVPKIPQTSDAIGADPYPFTRRTPCVRFWSGASVALHPRPDYNCCQRLMAFDGRTVKPLLTNADVPAALWRVRMRDVQPDGSTLLDAPEQGASPHGRRCRCRPCITTRPHTSTSGLVPARSPPESRRPDSVRKGVDAQPAARWYDASREAFQWSGPNERSGP